MYHSVQRKKLYTFKKYFEICVYFLEKFDFFSHDKRIFVPAKMWWRRRWGRGRIRKVIRITYCWNHVEYFDKIKKKKSFVLPILSATTTSKKIVLNDSKRFLNFIDRMCTNNRQFTVFLSLSEIIRQNENKKIG